MANRTGAQGRQSISETDGGRPRPGGGLFGALGRLVTQHPWLVIGAAIIVFARSDNQPLTAADKARAASVAKTLNGRHIRYVLGVAPGPVSSNGLVQTAGVAMDHSIVNGSSNQAADAVKTLRADIKPLTSGSGLYVGVTGAAAQQLDSQQSGSKAQQIVLLATLLLILILLLIIFRSPIVVLFGIGTDYILFLMFRYREGLRAGHSPKQAMATAVERVGEVIASAAGVVIVAFLALLLSSLSIFRSLGPTLAIAVAVTLIAAVTLVPAVVTLLGTRVFWPSKAWKREPEGARFAAIGRALGQRPAIFAGGAGLVLVALAAGAFSFNPTFDLSWRCSSRPA